jgi:guanylate kinase
VSDGVDRQPLGTTDPPLIIVLSGCSGAGKDTVLQRMLELNYPITIPATMTTRPPREGEVNGVHHVFVTPEDFDRNVATGELLEHALVYGNRYGVPRAQVRAAVDTGNHVMIRVDVQGAASLRDTLPEALSIFLVPDDPAHLEAHLRARGSEDEDALRARLDQIEREMDEARHFDHVIENTEDDLDATVRAVAVVIRAEGYRPDREPIEV